MAHAPRDALKTHPTLKKNRLYCFSDVSMNWPSFEEDELDAVKALIVRNFAHVGYELVAFCLKPKGFDLLIDIPKKLNFTKKERLARFEKYGSPPMINRELPLLKANDKAAWARLDKYVENLSTVMKTIKQQISFSYHGRRGSAGALWSARFGMVHVQEGNASRLLSAWLDHSAVREGRVTEAKEDRFCTYGAAVAKDQEARKMIANLYSPENVSADWRTVSKQYRDYITADGPEVTKFTNSQRPLVTRPELLRIEVPQFRRGVVIGDEAYCERMHEMNPDFLAPGRRKGARFAAGQNDPDLWSLRQLIDLRNLQE